MQCCSFFPEEILIGSKTDPYQLHNIHPASVSRDDKDAPASSSTLFGIPLSKVIARLDALLLVLKSCKGSSCVKPWNVLHPDGDVASLKDALNPAFDDYYETVQVKVEFSRCEQGQLLDAEGPQKGLVYRHGLSWSEWA